MLAAAEDVVRRGRDNYGAGGTVHDTSTAGVLLTSVGGEEEGTGGKQGEKREKGNVRSSVRTHTCEAEPRVLVRHTCVWTDLL